MKNTKQIIMAVGTTCTFILCLLLLLSGQTSDDTPYEGPGTSSNDGVSALVPGQKEESILHAEHIEHGHSIFSHDGGFYHEAFYLMLTAEEDDDIIYYTMDGSEPDPDNIYASESSVGNRAKSYVYSKPIYIAAREDEKSDFAEIVAGPIMPTIQDDSVFKATIIRAKVFGKENEPAKTSTATYFVGEGIHERYQLPVISIVTDEKNLFGEEKGIYVPGANYVDSNENSANYAQRGVDWEHQIHIEFYESTKELAFAESAGIRIHGGWSRRAFQKSFRIYFKNSYGSPWLDYELFRDTPFQLNDVSDFKRFILRSAASEGYRTLIRDGFMQNLVQELNIDVQSYRPAILFLNGEYWGIYNIRERIDKYYIATHHGVDPENIDLLVNPPHHLPFPEDRIDQGDAEHYSEFIRFISENDLSIMENYRCVENMIDMDSFIDYYISQIYLANFDWPHNNVKIWRPKIDGGKWRWLMFDVDAGFMRVPDRDVYPYGHSNSDFNALAHAAAVEHERFPVIAEHTGIFRTLLENDEFKYTFINRFADYLNTIFKEEVVIDRIDVMVNHISHDVPEHQSRWTFPKEWEEMIENMRIFAAERPTYQRKHIVEVFQLAGQADVTLITDSSKGYVRINSIDITNESGNEWKGKYFKGVPVCMSAIPRSGYRFVGWEGLENSEEASFCIELEGDVILKAIFEPE